MSVRKWMTSTELATQIGSPTWRSLQALCDDRGGSRFGIAFDFAHMHYGCLRPSQPAPLERGERAAPASRMQWRQICKLRAHGHEQGARAGRARDSLAPSAAAQQESAAVLGHDVPDFLRIRKTNHTPPKYSVYAAIMPIKKCNAANASQEFTRHHERHGDRFKIVNWSIPRPGHRPRAERKRTCISRCAARNKGRQRNCVSRVTEPKRERKRQRTCISRWHRINAC